MNFNGRKLLSNFPALLFLLLPLGAFPLAFLRLTGEKVPLFGAAEFITLPTLGLIALAVIVWNFSRLKLLWQNSPAVRFTAIAGALLMLAAVIQQFLYGGSIDHLGTALFYAALPLAAATAAPELRRMMMKFKVCSFATSVAQEISTTAPTTFAIRAAAVERIIFRML